MKIIIDTDVCKRNNYDPALMLYLASLYADCKITPETFEKARNAPYLTFGKMYNPDLPFPRYVDLNETGEFVIERVIAMSDIGMTDEELKSLANTLRNLFPEGKRPGTSYTWRDSESCIIDRLRKFYMKYGKYTEEEIIQATKDYVASFNGNYTYMQLLKYFIWKNKVTGAELVEGRLVGEVEKQSQLAAWIEDKSRKQVVTDWDVKLV